MTNWAMVMDETAIERVVSFSTHLRKAADILLGQPGIASVDVWTLCEIEEAFSLILETEQLTDFHVLPPNHRQHPAIPQIQFLYDILQKIKKLKILALPGHILPREQRINLKCFRNVNSLELNCVPIKQVKGLQNLRPILKSICFHKSCSKLEDVLAKCGADKSTDYAWENLKVAIFSHNILRNLDSSISLLTSVRILDLSYCELVDTSALKCLPLIYNLDLSYNNITTVPTLCEAASNSLAALDLGNNMILDIKGIEKFRNLRELDAKENFISLEETLFYLTNLPHLRYLNMTRNPITFSINYRVRTLKCFHPDTKYISELVLDDVPIQYHERKMIGLESSPPVGFGLRLVEYLTGKVSELLKVSKGTGRVSECICIEDPLIDSVVNNLTHSENQYTKYMHPSCASNEDSPKDQKKMRSRRSRTRHAYIIDPDDQSEINSNVSSHSVASSQHQEEVLKITSGKNYVSKFSPEFSELSLKGPLQSDKLLEEILHYEAPEDELPDLHMDEKEEENNKGNYSVLAKCAEPNAAKDPEFCVLSFSDHFFIERNVLTYVTTLKMSVANLLSMKLISKEPILVQLRFNSIRPDLCSKLYILEIDQYEKLKIIVGSILERKSIDEEVLGKSLRCKKCGFNLKETTSARELVNTDGVVCQQCRDGSKSASLLSQCSDQVTSVYLTPPCDMSHFPKSLVSVPSNGTKSKHKSTTHSSDSSESIVVGVSEASSIRRESDPEVISNPSLSSIEVLGDLNIDGEIDLPANPIILHGVSTPAVQDSKVENKNLANSKHELMQDSSSSGSMTGSVCTAVDRLSCGQNTPVKKSKEASSLDNSACDSTKLSATNYEETLSILHSGISEFHPTNKSAVDSPSLKEALAKLSLYDAARKGIIFKEAEDLDQRLEMFVYSLVRGYTGYNWAWWKEFSIGNHKLLSNAIDYCYEDFSQVDHRLELFVEIFLFKVDNERLQGLVKAIIAVDKREPFLGLLVVSDCKLYILKIIESEDDSPQNWLNEYYSVLLTHIGGIYSLLHGQGIIVEAGGEQVLICLADAERVDALCNFLTGVLKAYFINYKFENYSNIQEEQLMKEILNLDYLPEDTEIKFFQIISVLQEDGITFHRFLVVTNENIFLFNAELPWLFPTKFSQSQIPLRLVADYRIDDITKMEVLTDTVMKLHFYSEGSHHFKEPWLFHVPSARVGCHLIKTIRSIWVNCYKVEFDIICSCIGLRIVREILNDSIFSNYFK